MLSFKKFLVHLVGFSLLVMVVMRDSVTLVSQIAPTCFEHQYPTLNPSSLKEMLLNQVTIDDLVWHLPRPPGPRYNGWEDDWMMNWKKEHYDPSQRCHCERVSHLVKSPYSHHFFCHIPGYIPARLPLPPSSQRIPRVIFLSWKTRELGPLLFSSIMTLLHHNPEYELIFFNDSDMDRFVCNFPEFAPYFFAIHAGAARADVWRMLIIHTYGGVYLDCDESALGHLPIQHNDSVVASVGWWGHLPSRYGGVFEHWSMAFEPKHRLIKVTLDILLDNLRNPTNSYVESENATLGESSYIIRLTGPSPYQRALHFLLRKSNCTLDFDAGQFPSYVAALHDPNRHCNHTKFVKNFGNVNVLPDIELNNTVGMKLIFNEKSDEGTVLNHKHYEDVPKYQKPPSNVTYNDVCSNESMNARDAKYEQMWKDELAKK
jgi:alpha 1,6-mannosyltransferase